MFLFAQFLIIIIVILSQTGVGRRLQYLTHHLVVGLDPIIWKKSKTFVRKDSNRFHGQEMI